MPPPLGRVLDDDLAQDFDVEININAEGLPGFLGFRGHLGNLWHALCLALSSFSLALLLVEWLPFTIGRISLYFGLLARPYNLFLHAVACLEAAVDCLLSPRTCLPFNHLVYLRKSDSFNFLEHWITNSPNITGTAIFDRYKISLIGYCVAFAACKIYAKAFENSNRRALILNILLNEIASMISYGLKMGYLIFIEVFVFPFYCGILLFLAVSPAIDSKINDHAQLFTDHPFSALFFHWFIGFVFMFHIINFISVVRSVVRPGVLWFVRDPNDPSTNGLAFMANRPIYHHIKIFVFNSLVYFVVIMLVVGTASLAIANTPNVRPLRLSVTQIAGFPIDLALAQLMLPLWLNSVNARSILKNGLSLWLRITACVFRLTNYLFYDFVPLEAVDSARGGILRKSMALVLRLRQMNLSLSRRRAPLLPTEPQIVNNNNNADNPVDNAIGNEENNADATIAANRASFINRHGSLAGWHALLQNKAALPPPVTLDDRWEIIGRPHRVPASDNIRTSYSRTMIVPLTDVRNELDLSGLSQSEREIYLHDLPNDDPSQWTSIYLPPNHCMRLYSVVLLLLVTMGLALALMLLIPVVLVRGLLASAVGLMASRVLCRVSKDLLPLALSVFPTQKLESFAVYCQTSTVVPTAAAASSAAAASAAAINETGVVDAQSLFSLFKVEWISRTLQTFLHDMQSALIAILIGGLIIGVCVGTFSFFSAGASRSLKFLPVILAWFSIFLFSTLLAPILLAQVSHEYLVRPFVAYTHNRIIANAERSLAAEWLHCAVAVRFAWNTVSFVGRPANVAVLLRQISQLDDWRNIRLRPFMKSVAAPICAIFTILLGVPALLRYASTSLALHISHASVSRVMEIYAAPAFAICLIVIALVRSLARRLSKIVTSIRDDEYLIARVLHDLPDDERRQTRNQVAVAQL